MDRDYMLRHMNDELICELKASIAKAKEELAMAKQEIIELKEKIAFLEGVDKKKCIEREVKKRDRNQF